MKKLIIAMGLAALTAATASANTAYLQISDNNGNSTVLMTSGTGVITWVGTLGNWNINIDTGIADPPAGGRPATAPEIDLDIDNHFNGGAGNVLTIKFYADGLGPIAGSVRQTFGGTADAGMAAQVDGMINGSSVKSQSFVNGTSSTTEAFSLTDDYLAAASSGSTVGLTAVITARQAGLVSGDANFIVSAPDAGMTLAMLGSALTGLALFARNRKTA